MDDESDERVDDSDIEDEGIVRFRAEKKRLQGEIQKVQSGSSAANGQLQLLGEYTKSIAKERVEDLGSCLQTYQEERNKTEAYLNASRMSAADFQKEMQKVEKKLTKAITAFRKAEVKKNKDKIKAKEKKQRARQEKLKAKQHLQQERVSFWPRKTYCIVVTLDAAIDTPASSRRGSVDSPPSVKQSAGASDAHEISLSLSYITQSAYWMPRYDLSLTTLNATGSIIYRAELRNMTSETWKDAKVSLSTSEASFSGISDTIPSMNPWTILLAKKGGTSNPNGALLSDQEVYEHRMKTAHNTGQQQQQQQQRNDLFGLDEAHALQDYQMQLMLLEQQNKKRMLMARQEQSGPQQAMAFGAPAPTNAYPTHRPAGGLFGAGPGSGALQSVGQPQQQMQTMPQSRDRARRADPSAFSFEEFMAAGEVDASREPAADEATLLPDIPKLSTEEATWAEEGLTFTYEIPGTRTISPAFTTRRLRITTVVLKNINLSYVLIPKLRAAAFLKARIQNSSTVTLLKGYVGITLDSSFLGNTVLPRCSAGESFNLSLGVDPSVSVTYAKPAVKRSSTGLFAKDDNALYSRSCIILNTKPNRSIEGYYLDQVPVSQDERLRTLIVRPHGLNEEGASRSDGRGVTKDGKDESSSSSSDSNSGSNKKWGRGVATLRQRGEVRWDFKIEAGRGAKFELDYETRHPGSETVVSGGSSNTNSNNSGTSFGNNNNSNTGLFGNTGNTNRSFGGNK